MKVWADLSALARLAALCVLIGFVLGLFVACSATPDPAALNSPSRDGRHSHRPPPLAAAPQQPALAGTASRSS